MEDDSLLVKSVACVIGALLLIALSAFILGDAPREPVQEADNSILAIDTSNAAMMHQYGMPTKADVMEWHYHGQWGYRASSSYFVYSDLPGDKQAWDDFYGIENNPAFDK